VRAETARERAQKARGRALTLAHDLEPMELFRQYPTESLIIAAVCGFIVGSCSKASGAVTHSATSILAHKPELLKKFF